MKWHGLADGVLGGLGLAAVGGLAKVHAGDAVLGVFAALVLGVGSGAAGFVGPKELHFAEAVLAAELGVGVDQSVSQALDLPEGLVPAAGFDAPPFDFAFIDLFTFCCHGSYCPVPPTVM